MQVMEGRTGEDRRQRNMEEKRVKMKRRTEDSQEEGGHTRSEVRGGEGGRRGHKRGRGTEGGKRPRYEKGQELVRARGEKKEE